MKISGEDTSAVGRVATQPVVRVLLVEDNQGFAYFVRDLLLRKNAGRYTLEHASTLADGMAVLEKKSTDIVLLDLGCPTVRGWTPSRAFTHGSPMYRSSS